MNQSSQFVPTFMWCRLGWEYGALLWFLKSSLYWLNIVSHKQQECGFEYTSKLQKMYTDTHTSKDLNDRFQEYCSSNPAPNDSCEWHFFIWLDHDVIVSARISISSYAYHFHLVSLISIDNVIYRHWRRWYLEGNLISKIYTRFPSARFLRDGIVGRLVALLPTKFRVQHRPRTEGHTRQVLRLLRQTAQRSKTELALQSEQG